MQMRYNVTKCTIPIFSFAVSNPTVGYKEKVVIVVVVLVSNLNFACM